ncbi:MULTISPECIES: cyanophycinase [Okeania]|uniref:Cyanophycinase n=3 Tax=Okeania TaxID=1458928 RepID=A0A3N6P976_9CYAN|nr:MULTISPECIES: cyanophycinase [Okeania]NEP42078.1 cyanophycinase [Okeania sp. SIO2H7]NEP75248.1 cyanophycinase [Okeania sp. SIO2G5]NEP87765.1 cyanophycinase [Okeania sp. SIO2C2]NEP94801.1 cyanophycinase [Okeania sp. SIO2F5]NEQ92497.1 cyanophycinase [Okeania sp. SIO2G4]
MIQLESQASKLDILRPTKTTIMVIGGAEDKVHGKEILQTFFNRAGGVNARLAVIPSASREPGAQGDRYRKVFEEMGAVGLKIFDIRERYQGEDPRWLESLEDCTGVFMTGGDQLRLCSLLAETPLMDEIRSRAIDGKIALAGTSAGAAVMGHQMIASGGSGSSPNKSLVDLTTGLGILPDLIVDQHFHNRNRMARLLSAIATHPDKIGIGIDEDTCALFEGDSQIRVMGKGTVTIIDTTEMSYTNATKVDVADPLSISNLRVHIMCHGDGYDLHSHTMKPGLSETIMPLD